jgi:hypothetical protein
MIVTIMSIRNIHQTHQNNSELLNFGAKSMIGIIDKVENIKAEMVDRILQLFLIVQEPRVRSQIAKGLEEKLSHHVSRPVLEMVSGLNKLKRGVADMELDCDNAIEVI